jgi:predicted AAA+ superfamily ATPase
LDEITFCPNYEQQLKNLYDAGNVKVIASSSSASLLKSQSGLLTGRSITFEVLPLNYEEFLDFRNIKISKSDAHLHETYFKEYLVKGGIPEYVLTNDDAYIRELMDNIIYKDIAAVHGIRQISVLKDYFLLLMERSGKTLSINKIAKILGISTESSKRYFDLFCDTFIIYPVSRHGKLNEQLVSPKKIYCCDTGIRNYYTGERDWGAMFENFAFLSLKQLNLKYIYENTIELDFFSESKLLIECKFHNEELSKKQQTLFDKVDAKQKFIVRNYKDVQEVVKLVRN